MYVSRGSRVRSPPVPVVLSLYQRGSSLDGLAVYLSCGTKKFHDNESTHILHNFWTSTHKGVASPMVLVACSGVVGPGTRETASPTFFDRGTRPPLPPTV